MKKALLTPYGGVPDPAKQVNRLHTVKMGRETPVREFAHEVERLARLAYPELTSDLGGEEQRDVQRSLFNRISLEQFVSGIPPLLSRAIVERKVEDFQEAVEIGRPSRRSQRTIHEEDYHQCSATPDPSPSTAAIRPHEQPRT